MLDTNHKFLIAATNKSRKKLMRKNGKNAKFPCTLTFVQQFQLNRQQYQQPSFRHCKLYSLTADASSRKQHKWIPHLCTPSSSLTHTLSSQFCSSTFFSAAVAAKLTQPQLQFSLHFIPLHSSTISTKPLRVELHVPSRFRNFK